MHGHHGHRAKHRGHRHPHAVHHHAAAHPHHSVHHSKSHHVKRHHHKAHIDPAVKHWLLGGGIAEAMAHRIEKGGENTNPFGLSPLTLVMGGMVTALVLKR